jgi:hypothetical protein
MTVAPRARIRAILPRFALRDVNTIAAAPTARAAYATPWPKLPAEATTTARSGPILPSPVRPWTATQVPRPLNERIGLTVSTLTTTGTPSRALSPSWTNCGEPVNAGSIAAAAARMAAGVSSGAATGASDISR